MLIFDILATFPWNEILDDRYTVSRLIRLVRMTRVVKLFN